MLAKVDLNQNIEQDVAFNSNSFYAFPLRPESGLRKKLWQQILSIFDEYPLVFDQTAEWNCE